MKKHSFLIAVATLMGFAQADAFKLQSTFTEDIFPERTIERDETGITVSYTFPGAVMVEDDLYPGRVRLDIAEFGHTGALEEPELPMRIDSFEIPEGYEVTLSVTSANWCKLDVLLSPCRPLLADRSDEVYSLKNVPPIKMFDGNLPESPVIISDMDTYRDREILYVKVMPVKCIADRETMACEKLVYRINFIPAKAKKKDPNRIRHEVDEDFMRSIFTSTITEDDEGMAYASSTNTRWKEAPYYLILSVPEYKKYVEEFAEWKKGMGFNTRTVYSNNWTDPEDIKNQIKLKYDSLPSLEYVLLVGDAVNISPVVHPESDDSPWIHHSDYTYGCINSNGLTQDVCIGRINVSSEEEAKNVLQKIIKYEKNPCKIESLYKNTTHASCFMDIDSIPLYEDRRFVKTSEDIRNGLSNEDFSIKRIYNKRSKSADIPPTFWNNKIYSYGEHLPKDLLYGNFKWNGDISDIIESINNGSFYVLHRGHGLYSGWVDPKFYYTLVSQLKNDSLPSVFFNICCQTGAFSNTAVSTTDPNKKTYMHILSSFAEEILRYPHGGAVGVIAATETSYSGPNDVLAMEMFQAIWPKSTILTKFPRYTPGTINQQAKPVYALGKILQCGMNALSYKYDDVGKKISYTKRIFHCFGDPSMQMYTAKPEKISLSHNLSNPTQQTLTASDTVQVAVICKSGKVLVANGIKFVNPMAKFTIGGDAIESVVISGHNKIPLIGDNKILMQSTLSHSEIINITLSRGNMDLECDIEEERNLIIRIRPMNNLTSPFKDFQLYDGKASISTIDFQKGIYIVELIEDGVTVDSRKIAI